MTDRIWNGRAAFVMGDSTTPGKPIGLALTEEAARKTALALLRLKQTTITLSVDVQELLDALNYVLVGDPESRAAHRRMEAGNGMTPDGGYKEPEPDHSPGACLVLNGVFCGADRCRTAAMPGKARQL